MLSFFPQGVLDEILNLIESVSEEFPSYFCIRGIGIINVEKFFFKLYRRNYELVFKFKVGLKSLLQQVLSEPEFYGNLVYKLKKKMLEGLIFLISSEKLSYVTSVL